MNTTPPPVQQVHHYYYPQKSGGTAALLEVLPGLFQIFGIGHLYAGNVVTGLLIMFGYWLVEGGWPACRWRYRRRVGGFTQSQDLGHLVGLERTRADFDLVHVLRWPGHAWRNQRRTLIHAHPRCS